MELLLLLREWWFFSLLENLFFDSYFAIYVWSIIALLVILTFLYVVKSNNPPGHFIVAFKDFNIDCGSFYGLVSRELLMRSLPDLPYPRELMKAQGIRFWIRRRYLKVEWENTACIMCAAPFGKDYFFSLWTLERISAYHWLIIHIPFIGPLLDRLFWRITYYKVDTMSMFHYEVQEAFKAAIDEATQGRLLKEYSTEELRPVLRDVFRRK